MAMNDDIQTGEAEERPHARPPRAELYAQGKKLRVSCPRTSHAAWKPQADRPEPIELLEKADQGRVPRLLPLRHGRMLQSPFVFFRGAALHMATDLAHTPTTGIYVQACGDCHLSNFGGFATPERRLIFDINDLDETLPAPWEWDVKRLATSFVLAARDNGFRKRDARKAALTVVRSYRDRMVEFSRMRVLDVLYASIDVDWILKQMKNKQTRKGIAQRVAKARTRSVAEFDFPEMVSSEGGKIRIKDNPPLIYHIPNEDPDEVMAHVRKAFGAYLKTVPKHVRHILDQFNLVDIAVKVVGVGSVGTACAVLLLMAEERDPIFLQVKEARASVLEPFAGPSEHANHGERVVVGARIMQAASDMFLGWTTARGDRHFYIRQLKDMKVKVPIELLAPTDLLQYAALCARALARAHACTGEAARIAGYIGTGDVFPRALTHFAMAYADQSERDHRTLREAALAGRLEVFVEEA
ncbi:MAG: DUF2252 domain-containing protein [Accumulibacter sp.]|jgi:uncharacterized protein (DUF2252 family)|uniref:DUF2252 domain-containing protein n=1 Tax=Accumulibacter sp. TaxID=2053492 RepID=UPI002FC3C645